MSTTPYSAQHISSLKADTPSFLALQEHYAATKNIPLRALFDGDPDRFASFTVEAAGLFLDYAKNTLTSETMSLLFNLARERHVEARREAMFVGEKINTTEHRAVLHTALRTPWPPSSAAAALVVDGQQVNADVHAVLEQIATFTESVRSEKWRGYNGKPITDIVNIGIGGSDLGPKMVCQALRPFQHARLTMHFVSNVDGHDIDAVLSKIDPATTLFVIASKTFTTMETMMNAHSARQWFLTQAETATETDLAHHFVAVSTNTEGVKAFGIDPQNMFPFWDWVGGRYSVWSSIGLSVALAIGFERFSEFLAGAHAMDSHFRSAPLEQNMPAILALVGVWQRNFCGSASLSIAPYHQDLGNFPSYLQQLEMESNGKRTALDGSPVEVNTCPVIWGNVGTNGQHAYFQLLHQGTDITPVDFIAALAPEHRLPGHQAALLANCFAQSEAFMRGKSADEVRAEMQTKGMPEDQITALLPHRTFPGNRPSNTILMQKLTPAALGALIALYEHKVFVQGVIWGINSFDQWGVELGKVMATHILDELNTNATCDSSVGKHDSSTNGLINRARAVLMAAKSDAA
ncbi:glucose-6-phosphate isomerase [Glaciimonas immobilis]|uniref:Glucose-6-phosphate isomerase n=1 Tax=Glaciimonas immobilis TaxID=728004 RepID=A0A840RS63_9BURK|nr:glucose-6-phosphate isomerase [Glaciimonas immobilis]KAF3998002.1 glucose-6-phosphate isomerase [Glaciimonas immobilis]MBB5199319.1 glucose-6-phosphate isomerase [Glaciimonas immobilis]